MNFRTTAIATGLAVLFGTGAALAQSGPQYPPPSQQAPYGYQHHGHHGVLALIREEVTAGRISRKEGTLLEHRIREMHAERRAERQARMQGEGAYGQGAYGQGAYGQGNYPPPPSQQPPNPQ